MDSKSHTLAAKNFGSKINIKLRINNVEHSLTIDSRVTLLDALREYISLTGTKKGCDRLWRLPSEHRGHCGACTVLVNGRRINSCLTLAAMHNNATITTIEGLATGDELHPLQAAFIKHDALQCGYCTPGQICSAVGMLAEGHAQSDAEVKEQMSGNLCRCGAYPNIIAAIQEVRQQEAENFQLQTAQLPLICCP